MISSLITSIIRLIVPAAPAWVGVVVPALVDLILALVENVDTSDPLEQVLDQVLIQTDLALDTLPGWADLEEEDRDDILKGIVKLVLFIKQMIDTYGKRTTKKALKRALKRI